MRATREIDGALDMPPIDIPIPPTKFSIVTLVNVIGHQKGSRIVR